jgi:hypothetical protein
MITTVLLFWKCKKTQARKGLPAMNTLQDIERAIESLKPQERAELHMWLDSHHPVEKASSTQSIFEQGLGLFSSQEDSALLDEVVQLAYEERRRSTIPASNL